MVLDRFNAIALELIPAEVDLKDPLTSVKYFPQKFQENRYYKDIARSMIDLPWTERFGLTFNDVVNLPFSTYNMLKEMLVEEARQPDPDLIFKESVVRRLSDIVVATLRGTLTTSPPKL